MTKKKQHFVPKFILRKFSVQKNEKQIGIYNIPNDKFIECGSLKEQAYKKFFYGKNGVVENSLSKIENLTAPIIAKVIEAESFSNQLATDIVMIKFFTFIQESRTNKQANFANEALDTWTKDLLSYNEKTKKIFNNITYKFKNSAIFNIEISLQALILTLDLGCKLIVNKTNIPFIISDAPVVKYNQFLKKRNKPGGHNGLVSKGLQVFFPISPKMTIVYYDKNVYKVGNRKTSQCLITNEKDVFELNKLQFLNSNTNIYFNEKINNEYTNTLNQVTRKYRLDSKMTLQETEQRKNEDEIISTLVYTKINEINIDLNLSFIKETKKAKKYNLTEWLVELRNPEWRYNGFLEQKTFNF